MAENDTNEDLALAVYEVTITVPDDQPHPGEDQVVKALKALPGVVRATANRY